MNLSKRCFCFLASSSKFLRIVSNSPSNVTLTIRNRGYLSTFNNTNSRCFSQKTDPQEVGNENNVYYGALTTQIKAVKVISFSTSMMGIIAQPVLYKQISSMGAGLPALIGLSTFVGFFTLVTPVLLHLITKKYVTELKYNPETQKYTATVLSFFCTAKQIEFSTDDVIVPDVPGMFTSFKVKDIPLFVDPRLFKNPQHYGKLMGYDKPIDFKLFKKDDDKKS